MSKVKLAFIGITIYYDTIEPKLTYWDFRFLIGIIYYYSI